MSKYARERWYKWTWDRRRANGSLGDFGSPMIDLARWCVGDIARVSAHLGVFVQRPGPDGGPLDPANDSAALLLQFENGAQGIIHVSSVAYTADRDTLMHVALYGEGGTLEMGVNLGGTEAGVVIRGARNDQDQFEPFPVPDKFWGDVDHTDFLGVFLKQPIGDRLFIDTILEDRPPSPSFYDGLKAQAVIDAAIRSHQCRTWVSLS